MRYGLSPRDFWGTNPADFALLDSIFGFGLDAAALPDDSCVPGAFITPEEDAFATPWGPRCLPGRRAVFLNPPYSAPGRTPRGRGLLAWVQRAHQQAERWGLTVVLQIPHAPGTRAGKFCHRHAPASLLWPGRRRFLHPDTRQPQGGNSHDTVSVVLRGGVSGPSRYLELRRFAEGAPTRAAAIAELRALLASNVSRDVIKPEQFRAVAPVLRSSRRSET